MQVCPVFDLFLPPPCLVPGSSLTLIPALCILFFVEDIIAISTTKYFPEGFSGASSSKKTFSSPDSSFYLNAEHPDCTIRCLHPFHLKPQKHPSSSCPRRNNNHAGRLRIPPYPREGVNDKFKYPRHSRLGNSNPSSCAPSLFFLWAEWLQLVHLPFSVLGIRPWAEPMFDSA